MIRRRRHHPCNCRRSAGPGRAFRGASWRLLGRGAAAWMLVAGVFVTGGLPAAEVPATAGKAMHVLKVNCLSCHNPEKRKGGLDMTSRESLMKGGEDGPVVVDGKVEESPFMTSLAADADPHMPPKKQLDAAQISLLGDWLRAGAPWDESVVRGGEPVVRAVALSPLPKAYHPVMALALSPDGRSLAAGCGAEVVVFDVGGGAPVLRARARAHLDPVQSVAWTPDGRRLITGAFRRVMVWKASSLEPEREIFSGLTDRVTAVQVLPDNTQALIADGVTGEKGVVRVLDLGSGAIVRSWPAHADTVFSMALSADGTRLATAGGDALVRVWDVATGRESAKLEAHTTQVLGLAFNADASQLVTSGTDRQLKVWDVKTRENVVALATRLTAINAVTWSPAGPVFAVTDDGALLRYTDMKPHTGAQSSETGNESQLGKTDAALYCLSATRGGEILFAGTCDGRLLSWDKDGKQTASIDIPATTVAAAAPAGTGAH